MNDKTKLTIAAVVIAVIIGVASYTHTVREDARVAGLIFGNTILDIHESLKAAQDDLAFNTREWKSGSTDDEAILEYFDEHNTRMDNIIARYGTLAAPPGFDATVTLMRLSAQSQQQSDAEFAMWIRNGDESHKLRSDQLLQDAFEYESEGLAAFNAAKLGRTR